MAGTIKKMNWSRTMTAWESISGWRAKRAAYQQVEAVVGNGASLAGRDATSQAPLLSPF